MVRLLGSGNVIYSRLRKKLSRKRKMLFDKIKNVRLGINSNKKLGNKGN